MVLIWVQFLVVRINLDRHRRWLPAEDNQEALSWFPIRQEANRETPEVPHRSDRRIRTL
jgi:hypothetical protein